MVKDNDPWSLSEARLNLGPLFHAIGVLLSEKRWPEAIDAIEHELKNQHISSDKEALYYNLIARCRKATNHQPEGKQTAILRRLEAHGDAAVKEFPNNIHLLQATAKIKEELGDFDAALSLTLRQLVLHNLYPQNRVYDPMVPHEKAAHYYLQLGKPELALVHCDWLIEHQYKDPKPHAIAHTIACQALISMGEKGLDKAAGHAEWLMKQKHPYDRGRGHAAMAEINLLTGNLAAVHAHMIHVEKLIPQSNEIPLIGARLAIAEGRPADAVTILKNRLLGNYSDKRNIPSSFFTLLREACESTGQMDVYESTRRTVSERHKRLGEDHISSSRTNMPDPGAVDSFRKQGDEHTPRRPRGQGGFTKSPISKAAPHANKTADQPTQAVHYDPWKRY